MKTYLLKAGVRQAIAKAGETDIAVAYNAKTWIDEYPAGNPQLMVTTPGGKRVPVTVETVDNLITGQVPNELLAGPGVYSYVFVWTSGSTQLESGRCECLVLGSNLAKDLAHDSRRTPDWAERIFQAAEVIEGAVNGAMEARNTAADMAAEAETHRTAAENAQEAAETAQDGAEAAEQRAIEVRNSIPPTYTELSDKVDDLKSELTNTKNEIYNRSNVFGRFVSGGRYPDGSPKPDTSRATCDTLFRLNAGDVLACSGNATGQKFGIGGDCDDGTFYDSNWQTADFSYTIAKPGLYFVNAAMSNSADPIDPVDVTLSVTITDNTSRIAQNSDAISAMDAVCGYGERITSENYNTKLPDFNTANTNTIYNIFNCLTSISHYPSDCDYQSGTLITFNGRDVDTNWTLQLLATKKDNKSTIYFRYYIDSSWLGWAKLPGDVDLVRNANTEIKDHFVATSVSRDVVIDSNTKILGFGDSIMQGYSQITKNWLGLVADDVGCTVVNKAIGGACFGESVAASNYWISTQISGVTETEWNNATLIIVAAGTNDAGNNTPLSELKTKVQSAITSIKSVTNAPILFITPIRRGTSISDANLLKLPGIAGVIANVALANGCSIVNGFDFPIATYDIDQISDMTIDHLHPNNTGTAVYAQTLLSIIK